jgi:hypothetical protein
MEKTRPIQQIMNQSDKFFWHGYVDFYERFLEKERLVKLQKLVSL